MTSNERYKFWLDNDYFDEQTKAELENIKNNPKEIEERFYKDLEFGTGGLRGIIGAGTNRMNIYTVRKASQGLANYLLKTDDNVKKQGIVIAYDCRHKSIEFSLEAAKVFAGNGIRAYLFDELRPTPELSFAVRHLKAAAGIVVTASHNPSTYNGYKVYGEDGGQLSVSYTNEVLKEINNLEDITSVNIIEKEEAIEKGLLLYVGKEIDDVYIDSLKTLSINPELIEKVSDSFKIVYTPLHGTGNKPVRRVLSEIGFKNVLVVKEQELPDADFSTVKYPNPEDKASFEIAIELAKKEDVDLIIGTDPDADRLGVVVKNNEGDYIMLSGNQVGCLFMEYILSQKKKKGGIPPNGFVIKTIVSTELARKIAQSYEVEMVEVLTGFKFIGEQIKLLDEMGDKKYLFGFEESYGYLMGTFARDKDAVVASMFIGEMAAYYKSRNMSLYEGLQELYEKYGYYQDFIKSYWVEGKEGLEKIKNTMNCLRNEKYNRFGDFEVLAVRDYLMGERIELANNEKSELFLPKSNVMYYEMKDNSWFCVRPSGTEPKIKLYFGVEEQNMEKSKNKLENFTKNVMNIIETLLNKD